MRCAAVALAAISASALATAAAGQTPGEPQYSDYSGTVGPYRVGVQLIVAPDHRTVERGHYFYDSKLVDIPLKSVAGPAEVDVSEPGGDVFRLKFVGNGSSPPPLDFETSVGLAGTWTDGARTLPVRLEFETAGNAYAPGRRYAMIGDAPDATVEAHARRFLQGVLTGNRAEAASAVSYPLIVNTGARHERIPDKAALLKRWDAIFTPSYLALLKTAVPHDMFVSWRGAMVVRGAVWFDDQGATALNLEVPPLP